MTSFINDENKSVNTLRKLKRQFIKRPSANFVIYKVIASCFSLKIFPLFQQNDYSDEMSMKSQDLDIISTPPHIL